jgi:hypothetical protein
MEDDSMKGKQRAGLISIHETFNKEAAQRVPKRDVEKERRGSWFSFGLVQLPFMGT